MPPRPLTPSPIRAILALAQQPGVISFAGGLPDPALYPLAELAADAADAVADVACLRYGPSEGLSGLRAWVAARLATRGVPTAPEQVLIANGSQHALQVALHVLVAPGDGVGLLAPAYPGARQAAELAGARVVDLAEPGGAAGLAVVVAMTAGANPTGRTLDDSERRALAAACRASGAVLVEDDAYADLWYDAPPPPPLAAELAGAVLCGSFSKILAPGLRLGWLRLPPALATPAALALQATCLHANGLAQAVALRWLERGGLDAHLARLRDAYRLRRYAMLAAIARHLPGCAVAAPAGGMFCWLRLPPGTTGASVAAAALARGVAVVPGGAFHAGGSPDDHLRLCFASVAPAAIADGVARLAAALSAPGAAAGAKPGRAWRGSRGPGSPAATAAG